MWRRKATGVAALVIGAFLIIAGLVDHEIIASKNALCQSPIGQLGSAFDNTVAHDCGLVTALESAVGWLIVVGILGLILGIVVIRNSSAVSQVRRPARSLVGRASLARPRRACRPLVGRASSARPCRSLVAGASFARPCGACRPLVGRASSARPGRACRSVARPAPGGRPRRASRVLARASGLTRPCRTPRAGPGRRPRRPPLVEPDLSA
jgi:hypothetical protein